MRVCQLPVLSGDKNQKKRIVKFEISFVLLLSTAVLLFSTDYLDFIAQTSMTQT